jgi:hypothetical protein
MLILDENNNPIETDRLGDKTDVYYCTLDLKKPKNPDYKWQPLVFLDTYTAAGAVISVGNTEVTLPYHWSLITVCQDQAELIPIKKISGRGITAFGFNPLDGFMPEWLPIRITDTPENSSWSSPIFEKTEMLVIPIETDNGDRGPRCIIAGEPRTRMPDSLDLALLW